MKTKRKPTADVVANPARGARTIAELRARTPLGGIPIPPKAVPAKPSMAIVPTKPTSGAVAKPAEGNYVDRYLDEVAPASIVRPHDQVLGRTASSSRRTTRPRSPRTWTSSRYATKPSSATSDFVAKASLQIGSWAYSTTALSCRQSRACRSG